MVSLSAHCCHQFEKGFFFFTSRFFSLLFFHPGSEIVSMRLKKGEKLSFAASRVCEPAHCPDVTRTRSRRREQQLSGCEGGVCLPASVCVCVLECDVSEQGTWNLQGFFTIFLLIKHIFSLCGRDISSHSSWSHRTFSQYFNPVLGWMDEWTAHKQLWWFMRCLLDNTVCFQLLARLDLLLLDQRLKYDNHTWL